MFYTAIWSAYILQCVFCDSVHFIQVYACIGIQQNSLQLMTADINPLFLHSSSDVFRPYGTWRKHILALNSSLLELKGLCINGTITWIAACKKYQCRQHWYTAKLCLNNTVLRDVTLQSGRNLLTCQRNTLHPSPRQMTVLFIATTLRTSTPNKITYFTFMLPFIVIDFFLNNQQDALIIQIYSVIKLYMFRTSSLSIIRSSLLYIRHW